MLLDIKFWAALVAALFFWTGLILVGLPVDNLAWPIQNLQRFVLWVLVFPVLEEMTFRGWIQGELANWCVVSGKPWKLVGISQSNLVTSVIFTGLHVMLWWHLWAFLVFFPSLVFGYFKDRYQGVTAPIILHIFYNAGTVWLFAPDN